jgi:hypothetical protein
MLLACFCNLSCKSVTKINDLSIHWYLRVFFYVNQIKRKKGISEEGDMACLKLLNTSGGQSIAHHMIKYQADKLWLGHQTVEAWFTRPASKEKASHGTML